MWKKRILAFLLCLCMVIPSELATVFAEGETASSEAADNVSGGNQDTTEETSIPECACNTTETQIYNHTDECLLKTYCKDLVDNAESVDALYVEYKKLPENGQQCVLDYLKAVNYYGHPREGWYDTLSGMVGEEKPVIPEDTADDGTRVTLSGENLPEVAGVSIETINDITLNTLFENPTYFYDIKLTSDNVVCQPCGEVEVTLDISVAEGIGVIIYHVLADDNDIVNKVNNGTAYIVEDINFATAMPIAANAVKNAVGTENAICIEKLSSLNGNIIINSDNITFNVSSFSDFIIYTVDFSYNGMTYSIAGGSEILLSELFSQLGIGKDAKKAISVTFTDNTLVTVEQQNNGDWLLKSLQAFSTVENLGIIFEDGTRLDLVVTDAAHNTANDAVFTSDGGLTAQGYKNFSAVSGVNSSWSVWNGGKHKITIYLYDDATGNLVDYSYFDEHPQTSGWLTFTGNYWYEVTDYDFATGSPSRVDVNTLQMGGMGLAPSIFSDGRNNSIEVRMYTLDLWDNSLYANIDQVSKFANDKSGETGNRTIVVYANGSEVGRTTKYMPTFESMKASDINVKSTYGVWKRRGDLTSNATVVVEDGVYKVYLVSQNTISYNLNGGSGSFPAQTKTYGVQLYLHSTKPTKTGYTFANWKSSYDGSTWVAGANFIPDRTDTLVAQWTPNTNTAYKIEYYKDGSLDTTVNGTGTTGASISYDTAKYSPNYKFSSVSPANPTIAADGSTVVKVYFVKNTATVTGSIDHGTVTNGAQEVVIDQKSTAMTFTAANGYKISGITVNGSAASFTEGATTYTYLAVTITGNIEVKVTTTPIAYKLNYDSNGGSVVSGQDYNITTYLTLEKAPTKVGYTFNGWKPGSAVGSWTEASYTAGQNVGTGQYGNVTLVAQWTQTEHTATAVAGTGISETAGSGKFHYNDSVIFSATVKAGYAFDGWYSGDTKLSSDASYSFTMPDASVSYTAKAAPVTYTITYGGLDGAEASGNPSNYTVESDAISLKEPTKTGYTFTGWSGTGLTGENNKNVTIPKGSTENRTYTAHWHINSYTVSGSIDRGTVNDKTDSAASPYTQTVTYGASGEKMIFKPAIGYEIASIAIDGVTQSVTDADKASFTYTPTNVVKNVQIAVTTVPKEYTITWNLKYPDGTVKTHVTQEEVPFGSTITTPAVNITNYNFSNDWQLTSPVAGVVPATMPNNNLVIQGSLTFNGGSLTITKSGMEKGKSAEFHIVGKDGNTSGINVTVTVEAKSDGSGNITLNYLPSGTYTVTEKGWSWEYEPASGTAASQDITIATTNTKDNPAQVSFANTKKTTYNWLSGEFRVDNKFGYKLNSSTN